MLPTYISYFLLLLAALFLLNKIKEGKMPQIKDGRIVCSGLEAWKMICMNGDSKRYVVDLVEVLVSLDLDSDWEGEDGGVQNSKDNNSEDDQEELEKSPLAKKVTTEVCLFSKKIPKTHI